MSDWHKQSSGEHFHQKKHHLNRSQPLTTSQSANSPTNRLNKTDHFSLDESALNRSHQEAKPPASVHFWNISCCGRTQLPEQNCMSGPARRQFENRMNIFIVSCDRLWFQMFIARPSDHFFVIYCGITLFCGCCVRSDTPAILSWLLCLLMACVFSGDVLQN